MRFRIRVLLTLLLAAAAGNLPAAQWAWIMSVPHALSEEFVYKVRVLEIDGQAQDELLRYPISEGKHTITVQLLLDLEWEPDLSEGGAVPAIKTIEVDAESGESYLLAGRIDPDAPAESQLDHSWWEPIVYAVQ